MGGLAILSLLYLLTCIPSVVVMLVLVSGLSDFTARTRLIVLVVGITLLFTPMAFPFYQGGLFMASGLAFVIMLISDGWPGIAFLMTWRDFAWWNDWAPVVVASIACTLILIARSLTIVGGGRDA
jgi:hypothetical protein